MCSVHYLNNSWADLSPVLKKYITAKQNIYVITDNNVADLYLNSLHEILNLHYNNVYFYSITAGEQAKSLAVFEDIMGFLVKYKAQRDSVIINLGGGVVSDLGGFVASCYMRGISYINIPTSIIAQVDASVGGKTALNFNNTKNIIGAFYQPLAVLIDPQFIKTLCNNEKQSGWGEIFKYYLLNSNIELPKQLGNISNKHYLNIVKLCISYKQKLVKEDLQDKGLRQILNLGHTAGHGLELIFNLPHGIAISIGILVATEISRSLGVCSKQFQLNVYSTYNSLFKNIELKEFTNENKLELISIIKSDKKKTNNKSLKYILPVSPGEVIIKEVDDEVWQRCLGTVIKNLVR